MPDMIYLVSIKHAAANAYKGEGFLLSANGWRFKSPHHLLSI
jgi:hypothetical protein